MPALIANTVSLEEVLEVRGGPLNEQELWAVLTQSCEALHNIFIQGKARKRHFGTYTITPATILLCHTGNVKFSLDEDCTNDRSFTAPETYARRTLPSETALEKICVYSLGMSIYHAAEFEVPVGKPIILDESLENVLLTMCEDSAQARRNISQVLQACHSTQFKHRHDVDVVASLVESLLGDDIPDIELNESGLSDKVFENDDYHQIDREISPVLASPRHLPSPPPPQISTRGQVTAVQLVGSNHRLSYSLADDRSASPRSMSSTLEKYKGILEDSRNKRSMAKSLNGLDQLDSRPKSKSQTADNGRHSPTYQEVQSSIRLSGDLESRLQVNGSRKSTDYGLRRYSSANSVTSHSSSTASGPRSSMFSDGRSSSAVSLTHGSYAPESYFTDGYESEFYLTSHGSSVSRNRVRDGRQPQPLRDQRYLSVNDVGHPPLPKDHLPPDVKQFTSLPDISKGTKTASANNSNKVFFGPEFVMITEDPEKSIVNITPNAYLKKDAQKKAGTQNRRMVTVVALNGQKLQLMAEVSMTTKDLYDHVIKFLGITEKSFFGLAKIEEDEVIFLELDVKLSKYAPPKWKEPKGEIVEFILYFRVKFYVEHIALLSHLSSRHQFYLQLRKDILEGRLYCHEEAAFILAGLALQAETGDLDDSLDQEYFLVEHYLHPRIINKVSTEYAISQLPEFHQNFTGLSEDQAELDFVQEAQKLPEYGIHFYKVQASKKADAEKLYLGICVRGLTVYESMGHIKTPIHKHSWPLTKKISFKKKKFFIEPRANPDGARLTFYTNHYKKAKYLLSMCKAFHRFQMQMRTRLASIEHEVALDFASEKQQQKKSPDSTPRPSPYERTPLPPSYKQTSVDISRSYKQMSIDSPRNELVRSVSQDLKHSTDGRQQERYREYSIDVNHNIGNHGENMHEKNKASNGIQRISSVDDGLKDSHDDIPYVIDSTLNYQRSKSAKQQDAINPIQIQELEVPNRRDILRSPDREIRVIKLRKEPSKGLGITVLGGENSKRLDLGIYVKSITDGGAAANDGRLKAGDCILAVNGNSLEHVTHEKAVSLLKTTSSTVELVVSQSPHNVSAFDLSNIPNTAASNEEPQTLEVKPLLTPPQHDSRRGTWSSSDTPSEAAPSTLNFPSQDEPVTMISKSISSLASQPPTQVSTAVSKPSTVSVEVTSPPELQVQPSKVSMVESRLSSLDSHQSDLSSDSYTAGSERSTDHELSENTFTVELEKVNGSLGLSVTGGINTTVKHGAIYVKSLILNGPADRNGHVRVGDRILRVNGISLKSVTHKQAVEIIKKAPEHCTLLIDRSLHVNVPTSIKKTSSRNQVPDQPFVVELTKGIGGLGLSLVGGRDAGPQHGGLLRIKKMFPGQPAAQSDKLLVGDIVLEVNGKSIENATHQEAINMIRLEPSTVRLLVKRDPSSIPKELLNRTASDASDIDPAQLLNDIQSKLRTDVKSPTQTRPTLQLCNQPSLSDSSVDQLTNEKNDRTDVWVKQESPRIRQRDLGSLTYQFSDPLTSRHIEHEPVTSSNSLPGKFQLKSPYADKRTKRVDSSKEVDDVETRDSSKISSESDLSSLLTQIKSEDSLQRTFSPQAPLAEYEESDLDEGIMVNVDEGIMINVDDGTVINITDDDGDSNSDDSLEDDTRHSGTPLPSGFNGDDRQTGQQSSNMNAMHKYDDRDGITLAKTDKAYSDSDVITSAKTDKFYNDGDVITSVRTEKAYDGSDVFTPVTGDKAYDGSHVITPVTGDKAYDGSHVITSVTADEVDDGNDSTTSAATSKSGDDDDDNASIATSKDDDDEDLTPRKTHKDVDTMGSLDTYRTDNNDNITSTATYNDIEDNHNILMKTDKNEEKTSLDKYKGSDNTYNINITSDITSQVDNDSKNDSDDDSMSDEIDSAEDDIDSVLELLDNIHKGETKTTNTGNQQYAACNAPRSQDIVKQGHAYQTESEPELFNFKKLEDKLENIKPKEPDAFHASKLKSHSESSLPDVLNSKDDDDTSSDSDAEQPINDESTFNLTEQHDSDMSRLTPQEQLITVELEKRDSGGLGFTLAGGADTMGGCFVRDIIGDPAKADGRLQKGDQILQVDDIDIRDMKHMAAVNVLRATKKNVKLIVLRRPAGMVSDGSSLETVNLTRTSRGRIGLLLTEGQDGVILVDDVVPGEPAAVQGNLKHGDRIVEIGGCKVDGIGFLAARQQLDASRPVVQLLVERRNQAAYSKYSMGGPSLQESISLDLSDNLSQSDGERSGNESPVLEQTDEVLEISLDKGPRGFGFSLEAAPSSEPNVQGIFIKTISSGSVAEEDGRLRVGDQLLTVNNEDVRGLSHARVIGMLRKVTSTVTLQISRPSIRNAQPSASQSPPSNSLDLDITLEDKDTSTGSSEIKDEKELVDVLQSISSTNPETTPTVATTKPKLNKRTTDTVLSSLLTAIGSPPDNEIHDDSSEPLNNGNNEEQWLSSSSLEDKQLSDSSAVDLEVSSDDSDYDDVDVFDMLHDNSDARGTHVTDRTLDSYVDFPPPLPTTPIPSDDDDDEVPPLPPRRESSNQHINGYGSLHSSSEEEMTIKHDVPLVSVVPNGRYTGHKLKMLIGALQTKLASNTPADEFKALREIKPTDGCDVAKHPDNKDKNRYRNVLPFNSTRVCLGGEGNDSYINASHIRVPVGQETYHYIATQGPLPNTIKDFWKMVWEQGVEVIAMLTMEMEGGKVKCSKYWPDSLDVPLNIPSFQIALLNKKTSSSYTERTLSLKHLESGVSVEVTHLNFSSWPDHGVPKSSVEMVQFVTYMRSLASSEVPVLVHCSAGIGRTGAMITVDSSLGLIQKDLMFDVDKIIRILREQRQGMIQTKDQYIFCYKACLEVLRSLKD